MTRSGIEPQSPGPLANTQPVRPMEMYCARNSQTSGHKIILDGFTCRWNQSIKQKSIAEFQYIWEELGATISWEIYVAK